MAAAAHETGPLRFSTSDLAPKDRMPFWREVLGRSIAKLELVPLSDEPLHYEGLTLRLPGLSVLSSVGTPYSTSRTRALIAADGRDDIVLVTGEGRTYAASGGREATGNAGAGILVHNARPTAVNFLSGTRRRGITIPRAPLARMVADLDASLVVPIPAENEAMRLLMGYLELAQTAASAPAEVRGLFVNQIYDLVAVMIGATRDAAETAGGRGVRAARLRAIKHDIEANIGDDLSPGALARRHGISPRYLQILFEGEGTTLSRYVLKRRLLRVYQALRSPAHGDRPIGTLAYDAGFGDLSTFNREFRREFGATPSDVRAAARREL
jgi:AraC-like DNA-binding protein